MKLLLYKIVLLVLKFLHFLTRRNSPDSVSDNIKKFTHIFNTNFLSDFAPATAVYRTVPYMAYFLETSDGKSIIVADKHIFYDEHDNPKYAENFSVGNKIKTRDGIKIVSNVFSLGVFVHMYDVEIDSSDHLYYANNFLSHNTEAAAAFIIWYAIFTKKRNIMIAANKFESVAEIVRRVKSFYEQIPSWLKPGVMSDGWNVRSIKLENGSIIEGTTTTPTAARGKSIHFLYCLDGETVVTVRDKETGSVKNISLKSLYKELKSENE